MPIGFLLEVFRDRRTEEAIVFQDKSFTYDWLQQSVRNAQDWLVQSGVGPGAVVSLEADFSPSSISLLLALMGNRAITVPLAPASEEKHELLRRLAQIELRIAVTKEARSVVRVPGAAAHPLYAQLRAEAHPGLVLFTSGYMGEPKAALHDCFQLLAKYRTRRAPFRTLMFLLFDHIGGVDTLLQALANGGTVVIPSGRTPADICGAITQHKVEVLPAAPSFLNLLLLGEAYRGHDLTSLRYITYGAEVMPQATLTRVSQLFPNVRLLQKYGLTEVGTLRSHSRANDSLWVKVGGEGFQTRVVDGILQIKAQSTMLGYLNAESPMTSDGWFITGDAVEVDGDYIRILGRASDLINVGGRKVYPGEIESVVHEVENVDEVAVFGEPHPIMGQVVVARVSLLTRETLEAVESRIRAHCRARLEPYKVPVRVELAAEPLHSERQKITRR